MARSSQGIVVCLPTDVLQHRRGDQLNTTLLPLCRRYDKFSVDITEQVSVDLEGQHELTVEVFDPTGASKAYLASHWHFGAALLGLGRAVWGGGHWVVVQADDTTKRVSLGRNRSA